VVARIAQNHGVALTYDDNVVKLIAARCSEPESGGRMIDAILTNALLPAISRELLQRIAAAEPTRTIGVTVKDAEFSYAFA
jgi:type VI secretion system protein VasG